MWKLGNHKGTRQPGYAFRIDDLQEHIGLLGYLQQVAKLLMHHFGSADPAVQHTLIDEHQQQGRLLPVEDALPPHASFHTFVNLFGLDPRPVAEDMTSVRLGLKETRNEQGSHDRSTRRVGSISSAQLRNQDGLPGWATMRS